MTWASSRGMCLAVMLALVMHSLLFVMTRNTSHNVLAGIRVPPHTYYQTPVIEPVPMLGSNVRTILSPVVFSLPSSVGFSRELGEQDVRTRLTFTKPVETERFLDVDTRLYEDASQAADFMVSATLRPADPAVPENAYRVVAVPASARRVTMDQALLSRVEGGIVLPQILNQPAEKPWQVSASVHVAENGVVEHVLLDSPLESPAMNQEALKVLYDLRFRPGDAVDGDIQINAPNPAAASNEVVP